MTWTFSAAVWFWRGPAPFYFVTVPDGIAADLRELSPEVTFGWGMIPIDVQIGETAFYTALFPKDGSYIVPLRKAIREKHGIDIDDVVTMDLLWRGPTSS